MKKYKKERNEKQEREKGGLVRVLSGFS